MNLAGKFAGVLVSYSENLDSKGEKEAMIQAKKELNRLFDEEKGTIAADLAIRLAEEMNAFKSREDYSRIIKIILDTI